MITWWNGLELIQQIFAILAIPATLILFIQTILLLLGMGSDHDTAAHGGDLAGGAHDVGLHDGQLHDASLHDGSAGSWSHDLPAGHDASAHESLAPYHDTGLRLLTVRGLVAFFAIGGWAGIALIDVGMPPAWAGILALIIGFIALLLVAWMFRLMLGLQSNGNLDIGNAVGKTGEVYLRIPGALKGSGKITLVLQERSVEIDAMTDQPEDIGTGRQVEVIARRGERLLVRPLP